MNEVKLTDFVFKNQAINGQIYKSPILRLKQIRKQNMKRIQSQMQQVKKPLIQSCVKIQRSNTEQYDDFIMLPYKRQIITLTSSKQSKQNRSRSAIVKASVSKLYRSSERMRDSLQRQKGSKLKTIECQINFNKIEVRKKQRPQSSGHIRGWSIGGIYKRRQSLKDTKSKNQGLRNLSPLQANSINKKRSFSSISFVKQNKETIKHSSGQRSSSKRDILISVANPQAESNVKQYRLMLIAKKNMKKVVDAPLGIGQILLKNDLPISLKKFKSKGLRTVKKKIQYYKTCQPDQSGLVVGTKIL